MLQPLYCLWVPEWPSPDSPVTQATLLGLCPSPRVHLDCHLPPTCHLLLPALGYAGLSPPPLTP